MDTSNTKQVKKHNILDSIPVIGLDEFEIKGRGKCVVVDTNTLTNKEIKEKYFDQLISYNGYLYTVIGIEVQGYPDRIPGRTSLLLKEWGVWHQLPEDSKRHYVHLNFDNGDIH